jgi:predicted  nucleic acid-binding Zn-ribbon protein
MWLEQIKYLWELQEIETEISRKEKELKSLSSVEEYQHGKKDFRIFQGEINIKEEKLALGKKDLKRMEMELHTVTGKLKELNDQLYSGEIPSAKELESLEKKVQSKQKEKADLEDGILSLMDILERNEDETTKLRKEEEEKKEILQKVNSRARSDVKRIENELEQFRKKQEDLLKKIDDKMLKKYQGLSERFQGKCVSLVENGFCGICNVSLPSSFRARILTPGELVFCENCGCMLVLGD